MKLLKDNPVLCADALRKIVKNLFDILIVSPHPESVRRANKLKEFFGFHHDIKIDETMNEHEWSLKTENETYYSKGDNSA